jgi:hypothetical protein
VIKALLAPGMPDRRAEKSEQNRKVENRPKDHYVSAHEQQRGSPMKRRRYQKRSDELRKVYAVLSDVDNVTEQDLRSIEISIFHGADRRYLDQIINRARQYLERKDQSDASEFSDWFISEVPAFKERFGRELGL